MIQGQNDRGKATKGRQMAGDLGPGSKAPKFKLPTENGDTLTLADFKGKNLVLFFYPKADTPGCTKESIAFSKLKGAFTKANTEVVGVSADPVAKQKAFKKKHGLKVPLIADEAHEMIGDYGAWGEKSLYGRKFIGIIRMTFLIGTDGRIAQIWPKVRVEGHAEEVLEAAQALSS
ncbi:MAG: peroxiredoxin [Xanthobacteraceae bacterium]